MKVIGGDTPLYIEEALVEIDDVMYRLELPKERFTSVFINGEINIASIEYVDEEYKPMCNYFFPKQTSIMKFEPNNTTGYVIDKFIVNDKDIVDELIEAGNNVYYYEQSTNIGWNHVVV